MVYNLFYCLYFYDFKFNFPKVGRQDFREPWINFTNFFRPVITKWETCRSMYINKGFVTPSLRTTSPQLSYDYTRPLSVWPGVPRCSSETLEKNFPEVRRWVGRLSPIRKWSRPHVSRNPFILQGRSTKSFGLLTPAVPSRLSRSSLRVGWMDVSRTGVGGVRKGTPSLPLWVGFLAPPTWLTGYRPRAVSRRRKTLWGPNKGKESDGKRARLGQR